MKSDSVRKDQLGEIVLTTLGRCSQDHLLQQEYFRLAGEPVQPEASERTACSGMSGWIIGALREGMPTSGGKPLRPEWVSVTVSVIDWWILGSRNG
jgi:hypothetical protein